MNDKEIIALLQRQLEVSQATIEGLRASMSEMKLNMESVIEDLKKTVRSLEQALVDKGIETAKAKKALKNVAVLMEKHNERQHPSPDKVDEEFAPKEQKPKYDPKARGNNGARRLEHMECEERVIIEDPYISGDETFHKVRVGDKNDKGLQIRKGYIWDLVAHHLGLAYFFYSRGSRSEKVFEEIIEGYRGTFQSDAMPVYRKLGDGKYDGITRIPCLQHIKRRFVDIREVPRAAGILRLFNLLYDREHRHRIGHDGWTVADNLKWRREYAPPILERIKAELDSVKGNPAVPKDSDLMGAVMYALNEWEWVPGIFSGGDYDLDNNLIERMQRLVSLLRRNSLFFGSHKGGETAAMYLSLVVSCRLNGVDVMEYISDILNRRCSWAPTTPLEKYRDLLPDRWKPQVNGNE